MYRVIVALSMWGVLAATAQAGEIPDVVLRQADAFAQTHPDMEPLPPGKTFREEYARHFLNGFLHQSNDDASKSAMVRDAFEHGLLYWVDHPAERGVILTGFGFVAIDEDGIWWRNFEHSAFTPSNAEGEHWSMRTLDGSVWREEDMGLNTRSGQDRVHIKGYLSPKGHYGHLGGYQREVLVTAGVPLDAARPPSSKK